MGKSNIAKQIDEDYRRKLYYENKTKRNPREERNEYKSKHK